MKAQPIRELMFQLLHKGTKKSEIADILGVSRRTVSRWLKAGNVQLPSRGPQIERRRLTIDHDMAVIAKVEESPGTTSTTQRARVRTKASYQRYIPVVADQYRTQHGSSDTSKSNFTCKKAVKRNSEYDISRGTQILRELRSLYNQSQSFLASNMLESLQSIIAFANI